MNRYGLTRADLKFRLWFSVAGLILLASALVFRGLSEGPATFELVGIAGAFFGGTLFWTSRSLLRINRRDAD